MPPPSEILELNRELADQINRDARANPESLYAGKYVGIANGRIVAVTDTLRDAVGILRQVEPEPARRYCIDASRDYSKVEYI